MVSLAGPGMGLWRASPGNWSRLKITLFFRSSLTPPAFARLALSTKLPCQCWQQGNRHHYFWQGCLLKYLHVTLRKLSSLLVRSYIQHRRCLIASEDAMSNPEPGILSPALLQQKLCRDRQGWGEPSPPRPNPGICAHRVSDRPHHPQPRQRGRSIVLCSSSAGKGHGGPWSWGTAPAEPAAGLGHWDESHSRSD